MTICHDFKKSCKTRDYPEKPDKINNGMLIDKGVIVF